MCQQHIAALINESPMNRGMVGEVWLDDPDNIAIAKEDNVMLFSLEAEGFCQFHWLRMSRKGRAAIEDTREAMREVFATTNARLIYGLVPLAHRSSNLMARWIGAKKVGVVPTEFGSCTVFAVLPEFLERTEA